MLNKKKKRDEKLEQIQVKTKSNEMQENQYEQLYLSSNIVARKQ